jgi:hypothetical protein
MRPTHLISLGLSVASLVLPSQAIELDLSDEGKRIHTPAAILCVY